MLAKAKKGRNFKGNPNANQCSNHPSINLFKALPSLNGNTLELEKDGKKESRQKAEKKEGNKRRPHQRLVSLFERAPLMLKHENRMGFGDAYAFAMLSRYVSPSRYMRYVESLC
jgi:hypothetical protein